MACPSAPCLSPPHHRRCPLRLQPVLPRPAMPMNPAALAPPSNRTDSRAVHPVSVGIPLRTGAGTVRRTRRRTCLYRQWSHPIPDSGLAPLARWHEGKDRPPPPREAGAPSSSAAAQGTRAQNPSPAAPFRRLMTQPRRPLPARPDHSYTRRRRRPPRRPRPQRRPAPPTPSTGAPTTDPAQNGGTAQHSVRVSPTLGSRGGRPSPPKRPTPDEAPRLLPPELGAGGPPVAAEPPNLGSLHAAEPAPPFLRREGGLGGLGHPPLNRTNALPKSS